MRAAPVVRRRRFLGVPLEVVRDSENERLSSGNIHVELASPCLVSGACGIESSNAQWIMRSSSSCNVSAEMFEEVTDTVSQLVGQGEFRHPMQMETNKIESQGRYNNDVGKRTTSSLLCESAVHDRPSSLRAGQEAGPHRVHSEQKESLHLLAIIGVLLTELCKHPFFFHRHDMAHQVRCGNGQTHEAVHRV